MNWPYTHVQIDATQLVILFATAAGWLFVAHYNLRGSIRAREGRIDRLENKIDALDARLRDLERKQPLDTQGNKGPPPSS